MPKAVSTRSATNMEACTRERIKINITQPSIIMELLWKGVSYAHQTPSHPRLLDFKSRCLSPTPAAIIPGAVSLWICEWTAAQLASGSRSWIMQQRSSASAAISESLVSFCWDAEVIGGICLDVNVEGEATCVSRCITKTSSWSLQ